MDSPSPRSAFQKARDKSLKELSESFVSAQALEMSGKSGAFLKSQQKAPTPHQQEKAASPAQDISGRYHDTTQSPSRSVPGGTAESRLKNLNNYLTKNAMK